MSHELLVAKLEKYGFRGHVQKIFQPYLSERKQCVMMNGASSGLESVNYGIPQGSIHNTHICEQ
nr:unnamed protein product [Callosobruchus analis]